MPRAWAVRPCWGSGGWWVRVRGGPFGPAGVRGPPYSCGVTEPAGATPSLTSRTRRVDAVAELLPFADAASPLVFVRRGEGVVGVGEALRLSFAGPTRLADAAAAWRRVVAAANVDDPVQLAGSGLIAFGAFAFAAESAYESVLVVPRLVVGRRDGVSWVTEISVRASVGTELAPAPAASPLGAAFSVPLEPGQISEHAYREMVADAVARIRSGDMRKVVVARDLVGQLPAGADPRRLLDTLARAYPDTWTFAVDGHLGSSPETLVQVSAGTVSARVLAGSAGRGADAASDQDAERALLASAKDLDEHRYAVESVLTALEPHAAGTLTASAEPYALQLPNLWHLATNVDGTLSDGASALDLAAGLHPTAAVAGTPTPAALAAIRELEPLDRGRYGGPVGWVDAHGDGVWAVSLRSAELDASGTLRAFAGAGILAESDPATELAETTLKFRPLADALA